MLTQHKLPCTRNILSSKADSLDVIKQKIESFMLILLGISLHVVNVLVNMLQT